MEITVGTDTDDTRNTTVHDCGRLEVATERRGQTGRLGLSVWQNSGSSSLTDDG